MNTKTTSCTTEYIGKRPDWYKGSEITCWVGSEYKGGTKVIVSDPLTLNNFLIESLAKEQEVRAYCDHHKVGAVEKTRRGCKRWLSANFWASVPDHALKADRAKYSQGGGL